MPRQFKGQIVDSQGNKLKETKVTITGDKVPPNTSTMSDSEGKWLITLENDVDPMGVSIVFSKSGFETKSIKNPQPTSELEGYIDPKKGGTLDLAGKYPSGKYKISSLPQEVQDTINKEIEDAYNFAKNNPNNTKLEIDSSESQTPNTDNEGTNKDFTTPGSLAEARAQELEKYVNDKINTLYAGETNPSFQKPIAVLGIINKVGDVVWDGGNVDDAKYAKDQYTRLKANIISIPPKPIVVDYTYLGRVDGDTIYVDIRNNLRLIGEKKFSITTYTVDRAVSETKEEGNKFGFSFDGTFYPPQNPTQST
jgi:hypothetical protein